MRRDLLIALFVSVLVHGWLALGFNTKPPPLIPDAPPPPTIEISLPPPEAEDVPLADSSDQPPADPAPAPPMQADLPSVNLDTPFVQPIQQCCLKETRVIGRQAWHACPIYCEGPDPWQNTLGVPAFCQRVNHLQLLVSEMA